MEVSTIEEGLKKYFKFDEFKSDLQREAVIEVCQRKHDVFISMPTGSGKSLCYQLPAVLQEGKISIIFSPLLALIKDQIDHLIALKIRAASLNSKIGKAERESLIADLKSTSPNTRILYVTPEQAATATFKDLYQNLHNFQKIAYLVVDEAHCVSEWGHDFRPQYQRLGELREKVDVPCIALTATANTEVTKDIITSLRLGKNHKTFKTSSFRSNLFYDVYFPNILEDPFKHLRDFINDCLNFEAEKDLAKEKKSCGIIYCRTREQTELLMERLNKLGIKSLCYHAGLKTEERKSFQDKWQNGDVPVICATISFGMGVDKASVRFVIHWGSPKDPASFYQESGRAGRDGKPSRCRVYYNRSDSKAIEFHLVQDLGKAGSKENKRKRMEEAIKGFKKVLEFCENPTECRHRLFSNHFGEPPPKCKDRCDFCKDKKNVQEMVEHFLTKRIQFNSMPTSYSSTDFDDLYGYGRKGISDEQEGYKNGNDGSDDEFGSFEREQAAKKATNDFIQKQFALRRNQQEVSRETIDKLFSKHARVKAAASTSSKVKGLTLATREQYLTKLVDVFYENYSKCQEDPTLDRQDVEDCSVDAEYEVFSANTNMTMYRNSIARMISNVKKLTADEIVHEKLLLFEPKPAKNETLSDLFRNITKEQQLKKLENPFGKGEISNDKVNIVPEFKTARQELEEKINISSRNQPLISNFFKKSFVEKNEIEEKPKKTSENSVEMSGRKDLKSLFGDDDSEEENFPSEKNSRLDATDVSDNCESVKNSRDKHKSKHSKSEKHSDKHREKNKDDKERKRRKSTEREDDKKRKKEEEMFHKRFHYDIDDDGELSSTEEKYNELVRKETVDEKHNIIDLDASSNMKESLSRNDKQESKLDESVILPEVKPHKQNGESSKKQRLKKTEVGGLVVKLLTPAYADRRFESRDLFKSLARSISHALADKDENEIKDYVHKFLEKNEAITSQTKL
ncbi:recQ5 helicase [Leptinotarsa decemlineata]|uniref:recQ5 helicase n=1 Tax=Leptinotarsa decemlineata TaxID=7539 RepID=UPI003D305C67